MGPIKQRNIQLLTTALGRGRRGGASLSRLLIPTLLAGTVLGGASMARAQEDEVEAVVVTGSRIVRPGFTAPTPVTTLTIEELEARAPGSIVELQDDIPQFKPNLNTNSLTSGAGQSNLDLRGLGASRTLVLVDGRRMPATQANGLTDIGIIPPLLIQRIDLVTGGASAAYGSDAVSGVVNFILDRRLDGFKGLAQTGQTQVGDAKNFQLGAAYGHDFAGDRGHFVIAGEWYDNKGAELAGRRDWSRDEWGIIQNPAYVAGNSSTGTRLVLTPGTRHSRMTLGGVITGGPTTAATNALRGIEFGPGGTREVFNYGTLQSGTWALGGDGSNWAEWVNVLAPQKRKSLFAGVEFEVAPNVTAWADASYARNEGRLLGLPNYRNADVPITRQNAFLPSWLGQLMDQNAITSFTMGRSNLDVNFETLGRTQAITDTKTGRYAGGLRGKLGDAWDWSAHVQYGKTDFKMIYADNEIVANWRNGVDSVLVNGQPTCRINADAITTNDDPRCVAGNVFGYGSLSPAFLDYAFGESIQWVDNSSTSAAFEISGEPVELWAGPVSVAAGAEYRKDKVSGTADPLSQANGFRTFNPNAFSGSQNVKEAFAEVAVPLASEAPWAYALDANGAFRITDYRTSGTVTTWKVGLTYQPIEEIRLRGTLSRDIRAPNLAELFTTRTTGTSTIIDRATNTQSNFTQIGGGNPNLQPEIAKTYTYGVVFRPTFAPGLQLSLDYYDIRIKNAIGTVGAQQVADNCFAGQTIFCPQITRDPATNRITQVQATPINFSALHTSGVDFDSVYNFTPEFIPGRLTLRAVVAYVDTLTTTANNVTIENLRDAGRGVPKWRVNGSVLWSNDPLTLQLSYRFVGRTYLDSQYVEGVDINENDVASRHYLDGTASYEVREGVVGFLKVENIFDRDPPLTPGTSTGNQQAGSNFYQTLGRTYTVGLRLRF